MRKRTVLLGMVGLGAGLYAIGVWAKAQTPAVFTLRNGGEHAITSLRLASPSSDAWGPDRLAVAAIPAGEQALVTVDGALATCIHDLRADFEGGGQALLFSVDLCRMDGEVLTLSD